MRLPLLLLLSSLAGCTAPPQVRSHDESPSPLRATSRSLSAAEDLALRNVRVRLSIDDGISASDSGIPGCIVQFDPPAGVDVLGERILEFEALRQNQFLMGPWEHLVTDGELEIQLRVSEDVRSEASLGINVIGYVSGEPGMGDRFVRLRLEQPLTSGAEARPGDPKRTTWGAFGGEVAEPRPLAIDEPLPSFELPRLGSDDVWSVDSLLGARPFVLVTYRGHWWGYCKRQLVELEEYRGEFEARGYSIVAVSQEDPDLASGPGILDGLDPRPSFPILIDVGRQATPRLDRATGYLVDREGRVSQVLPMMTHMRATARVFLEQIDRGR